MSSYFGRSFFKGQHWKYFTSDILIDLTGVLQKEIKNRKTDTSTKIYTDTTTNIFTSKLKIITFTERLDIIKLSQKYSQICSIDNKNKLVYNFDRARDIDYVVFISL